jgi:signal recognition particle subunit SRP54
MFDFLTQKLSSIFATVTGKNRLTAEQMQQALTQVKEALLEADVPYQVTQDFINSVSQESQNADQFLKNVHDRMLAFLGGAYTQESYTFQIPSVVLMMGLQGSGKTTTLGKVAYFIKNQAEKRGKTRKILCASVDFYRPAAVAQLEIVAKNAGVDFYQATSVDPIQATHEIYQYFKKHGYEHLLLDTAGRLQIDEAMMTELVKIKHIVQPKYSFLVVDAMTGQESLAIAQTYEQKVGFDSAILTKMDSQARGGASFAFRYVLKKPIAFVGMGEKIDQLEIFRPERAVSRMLGRGDLLTLMENAQEKIKIADQQRLERNIMSGEITLDDFAKQLQMVSSLGSISSVLKFMPGMGSFKISDQDANRGEKELKRFRVILSSMTTKERLQPTLLGDMSRKKRIAQGAGVSIIEVNLLLQRFEQSKQFVKLLKRNRFFDSKNLG